MESYILNVLFDFDILIDTDIGCIRYMLKSNKFDQKYFKPKVKRATQALLKHMVICNKDINPLKIVLKEEYYNSADDLWAELKEKHYEGIINHSPVTDIFKLGNTFALSQNTGIICNYNANSDYEYNVLKKLVDNTTCAVSNQSYDATAYNIIYISKYPDLKRYDNIKGNNEKKVCIVNRACNILDDKIKEIYKEYFPCAFNMIDLYKGFGFMEE